MKLHNILEEQIIERVKAIYVDAERRELPWLQCSCEQCQLDTAAYVLNRITPRYVVSERGIAHAVAENENQLDADVDHYIIEGMKKVASVTRFFHGKHNASNSSDATTEYAFNFPFFNGALFDGKSFEPLKNAKVTLKYENEVCPMHDNSWINPYLLHDKSNGRYTFWIKSIPATAENIEQTFTFLIEIQSEGYEDTMYSFSVDATSTSAINETPDTTTKFNIQDLYLFSPDSEG